MIQLSLCKLHLHYYHNQSMVATKCTIIFFSTVIMIVFEVVGFALAQTIIICKNGSNLETIYRFTLFRLNECIRISKQFILKKNLPSVNCSELSIFKISAIFQPENVILILLTTWCSYEFKIYWHGFTVCRTFCALTCFPLLCLSCWMYDVASNGLKL